MSGGSPHSSSFQREALNLKSKTSFSCSPSLPVSVSLSLFHPPCFPSPPLFSSLSFTLSLSLLSLFPLPLSLPFYFFLSSLPSFYMNHLLSSYNGGRSADDIINFINGKAGSRGSVKKDPNHVVELDPSNFDKIVMDTNKDVLVEFYAPCE